MSINRPDPGENYTDFLARRAAWMRDRRARQRGEQEPDPEPIQKLGYIPLVPTRMVLSPWTTDEHGNAARQLRGT